MGEGMVRQLYGRGCGEVTVWEGVVRQLYGRECGEVTIWEGVW